MYIYKKTKKRRKKKKKRKEKRRKKNSSNQTKSGHASLHGLSQSAAQHR